MGLALGKLVTADEREDHRGGGREEAGREEEEAGGAMGGGGMEGVLKGILGCGDNGTHVIVGDRFTK